MDAEVIFQSMGVYPVASLHRIICIFESQT